MSLKKAQMRSLGKATSPAVNEPETTGRLPSPADRPRSLLDAAHDMIVHRHLSSHILPRGLYVGLLQLTSSRDSINVLVSRHQPNVLPYAKVRDNPNVTRFVRRHYSAHAYTVDFNSVVNVKRTVICKLR